MAWKLTLEEINEYKAAFTVFDKDNDGRISTEEMGILMRSLGQNFSNAELNEIIIQVEMKGHGGSVEFHEFLDLMAKNRKEQDDQDKLIKAFKYFDKDNTGLINFENFKHVLTTVAEKLNAEETEKLIEIVEVNETGQLKYREMLKLMFLK
jgi:calmodulin